MAQKDKGTLRPLTRINVAVLRENEITLSNEVGGEDLRF